MKTTKSTLRISNPPLAIALVALVVLIIIGLTMSDRFGTFRNFTNLLEQAAPLGIIALAQMLVVLVGGIDLSIGAMVTACSIIVAALCKLYPELAPVIVVATMFAGVFLGMINGLIINWTGVHPLIVTLGTSSVINGVVLIYTMRPVGSVPLWLEDFSYGASFGIPNVGLVMIAAFLLVGFLLKRTATGHAIYAVGGNEAAARAAGLKVKRISLLAYSASGFLAALAGIYLASRTGTGDPRVGDALTLASITPVVVGGTVLGGGVGTVFGTFVGVMLVSVLGNVLNYLNVSTFVQWVIQGVVILMAVSLYVDRNRKL